MWPLALASLVALAACAQNAAGPAFTGPTRPAGTATVVYVFRDKAAYAAQADHVVRPVVTIDGLSIGHLKNGGFLMSEVAAGRHIIVVGNGDDASEIAFTSTPPSTAYVEVSDKTRMRGARAAVAGLAFGAVGGIAYAIMDNARTGGEGRTWQIDPDSESDALAILTNLRSSE